MVLPLFVSGWFSVASADATLAVAETGGCKTQAPSRGTETQRRLRASSARNGVCRFGRKALAARRWGRAPKHYRRQPDERLTAGRRKTVREVSSPDGRDAARPGAPVSKDNENRRIEPDPQGHARLIIHGVLAREIELRQVGGVFFR